MTYLVCRKCHGYYGLHEGESPEDFDRCNCGGELITVDDIDSYIEDMAFYKEINNKTVKKKKNKKLLFISVLCIIIPLILVVSIVEPYLSVSKSNYDMKYSLLGSDSEGHVTKKVYSDSYAVGANKEKIAIVTGIHPRENLSKTAVNDVIKQYPLSSNIEIVHYNITVTDHPYEYEIGRENGEDLAAKYILPDILKSDIDLVIICHDHKPGYGEGFYIATPKMDDASVNLADSLYPNIPEFRYYKANGKREHSTSVIKFSNPLASAGYKTFVYEIPEDIGYSEAYNTSYKLIETCFKLL